MINRLLCRFIARYFPQELLDQTTAKMMNNIGLIFVRRLGLDARVVWLLEM